MSPERATGYGGMRILKALLGNLDTGESYYLHAPLRLSPIPLAGGAAFADSGTLELIAMGHTKWRAA